MKVAKIKSHNFPLLYHETFRKIKLKISTGQSGNQLSELLRAWGNLGKERQQKEASSTYLQGLLILQSQQMLWGGSRKLSQSVIPWMVPCSAAFIGWPTPKLSSAAPSFAASSCLMSQCGSHKPILCMSLSLHQETELVENTIGKWGLKTRYVETDLPAVTRSCVCI